MNSQPIHKEAIRLSGKVIVRSHPVGTIATLRELHKSGEHGLADTILRQGKVKVEQKNLIVDSSNYGIDIIIQYLLSGYIGSTNFPLGPAWGEIGTGNTTPAIGDTALTTPTNRATVSYAADVGFNEAQLQFFFPDAILMNTSYYEFGTFVGGSSSIGSGNMFNHALFSSAYSKTAGTDTTCQVNFTLANS